MHKDISIFIVLTLLVGLTGCSNSEEKAKEKFDAAYRTEQAGRIDNAKTFNQGLLDNSPGTTPAQQAHEQLAKIQKKNEGVLRQAVHAETESIRNVVEAYHSVYRRWPQSIKDFDDGEYLFDSDYMSESLGDNFSIYLAMSSQGSGYRFWSFPQEEKIAFRYESDRRTHTTVPKEDALAEIENSYSVEERKGSLTFLIPRLGNIN